MQWKAILNDWLGDDVMVPAVREEVKQVGSGYRFVHMKNAAAMFGGFSLAL